MHRSKFTTEGLDIGRVSRNLTYYYGLSDFWYSMFEDTEKVEFLLEANSQRLSDTYSKFLQLASTISIEDLGVVTNQQLKLVLIKNTDAVDGKINTFSLPETILSSRLIANRPFLPTAYLENNIHYRISDDGTEIQFYDPVTAIGFPTRKFSDGTTQYAMWFVDVLIDEEALYEHYGKLIGVDPRTSTDNYKNFIFGLYYLFANGPNLSLMRKGLNLALGIPLARESETVLETRKYLDTDQYLVITDLNSYLIPYGLVPTVVVGDVLYATQELAEWVEVKDWIQDGDWWINLQIPSNLMPFIPPGGINRYATAGSYADYVMRNFLYKHTFLVNVRTIDFKNLQSFEQLSEIINKAKPTYTSPIYIWTVPTLDEIINLDDSEFLLRWDQFRCENLTLPIDKMIRLLAYPTSITTDKHSEITVAGNKITYTGGGTERLARTAIGKIDEDWYWEIIIEDSDSQNVYTSIGVALSTAATTGALGSDGNGWAYSTGIYGSGSVKRNSGSTSAYGSPFRKGDVVGVTYKSTTHILSFTLNGVGQGNAYTGLSAGTYYPAISIGATTTKLRVNFGGQAFSYAPTASTNPGVFVLGERLKRGCPQFVRDDISAWTTAQIGGLAQINGDPRSYDVDDSVAGYGNIVKQFRANTTDEIGWLKCFTTRDQESYRRRRKIISFDRGLTTYDNTGVVGRRPFPQSNLVNRVVFLYTTTQSDLATKFAAVGSVVPPLSTWTFTMFEPYFTSSGINVEAINNSGLRSFFPALQATYSTFFYRGAGINYLGQYMPASGYRTYAPLVGDLQSLDYLLFVRLYDDKVHVFWITSNNDVNATAYNTINRTDPLAVETDDLEIQRGMGYHSGVHYLRAAGAAYTYGSSSGINGPGIDGNLNSGVSATVAVTYTDQKNVAPVTIDRSGRVVKIRRDWM